MTSSSEMRRAVRSLAARPWFSVAAIASLAFGIGANATVFTIVNALLFRPLPYREADRLVFGRSENARLGVTGGTVSMAELELVRGQARSLTGAGLVREGDFNVTLGDRPRRLRGAIVSATTLPTLGVVPARGSGFGAADDLTGSPSRVLISDGLWRSALGSAPAVAGATLRIDGATFEIAGVMPPGFDSRSRPTSGSRLVLSGPPQRACLGATPECFSSSHGCLLTRPSLARAPSCRRSRDGPTTLVQPRIAAGR